ncbi:hypothetical protein ACH5AG_08720 [Streptomyces anulatus]
MSAPMTPDREQEIRTLDLLDLMSDRAAPVISGHLAALLAEVERLRIDRDVCRDWADTLAYKVAPVEVLGRHGEEGKYPWGDALELLTPAAEVDALEARHAAVLSLHRKHSDSEHCFADDEAWPCQTLIALGRTDAEPPSPTENAAELRADNDRLRARVAELEGDLDAGVNVAVRDALVGSAVREARAKVLTEAVALIQANPHPGDDPAAFYASLLQDRTRIVDSEILRAAPDNSDDWSDEEWAAWGRVADRAHASRPKPDPAAEAERWNAANPVGSLVAAYPGCRPEDDPKAKRLITRTRSKASVLGGHTAVVWVHGHSACISLSHVDRAQEGGAS